MLTASATSAPALFEWRNLLDVTPLSQLLTLLRSPSDEAARLRQSSPFAGLLTPEERRSILDRYGSRRARACVAGGVRHCERTKLVAGRQRDLDFVQVLVREGMVDPTVLRDRLSTLTLPEDRIETLRERLLRVAPPRAQRGTR